MGGTVCHIGSNRTDGQGDGVFDPVLERSVTYLDQMSCALWAAISEVVSIDGQHTVVFLQLTVSVRHTAIQHVGNEYPGLIHLAHQFYPQLLLRAAFVENHVEAVIAGPTAVQRLPVAPAPELLLPQHSEPQHPAGLPQQAQRVVVTDVADVHPVDLGEGTQLSVPPATPLPKRRRATEPPGPGLGAALLCPNSPIFPHFST